MNKTVSVDKVQWAAMSVGADRVGRVFTVEGSVYRAIMSGAEQSFRELLDSGLLQDLEEKRLIPKTTITEHCFDGYPLVVQHETVEPLIYPHEWSYSMFREAALVVLRVNEVAQSYGYQTKDCHGYNVLFFGCRPLYVDVGSFVKHSKGLLFADEFIRYYQNVHTIWLHGDTHAVRRQLSDAARIMPHESFLLYSLGLWVKRYRRNGNRSILFRVLYRLAKKGYDRQKVAIKRRTVSELVDVVNKWNRPLMTSAWANYHDKYAANDGQVLTTARYDKIISHLDTFGDIRTVADIGGNQGVFARLLLCKTSIEKVYCIDSDEVAVDKLYLQVKNTEYAERITPIVMNYMFPYDIYSQHTRLERSRRLAADATVMLALTHHLLLGQGVHLDYLLSVVRNNTRRLVCMEFMPLGLWDGVRSDVSVPSWYNQEWFRDNFQRYYDMHVEEQLEENRILYVGTIRT